MTRVTFSLIPFIVLVLILSSGRTIAPEDTEPGLAVVEQVKGKYVFVMSKPKRNYTEVAKVNTAFSDLADMEKNLTQSVKEMVKKGLRREKNGKIESFDAVITEDGAMGRLIKFK